MLGGCRTRCAALRVVPIHDRLPRRSQRPSYPAPGAVRLPFRFAESQRDTFAAAAMLRTTLLGALERPEPRRFLSVLANLPAAPVPVHRSRLARADGQPAPPPSEHPPRATGQ